MADTGRANTAGPQPTGTRRRRDRSRGAVLVEAAIMFPVLVLLTFGAIEFGLVFHDELIISTAARSGARIGTSDVSGTSVSADDDWQVLQSVDAALGGLSNKVVRVVVYLGDNSNYGPPTQCQGTQGVVGLCNVYTASDLTISDSSWLANPPADSQNFTIADRLLALNTTGTEPTYLGVAVTTTHNYITGLFGSSRTLTEYSVFRYQPNSNTSHANPAAPLGGVGATTSTVAATTTAGPTTTGGGGTTTSTTTSHGTSTTSTTGVHRSTTSTSSGPTTTRATTTTTTAPTTTGGPPTTPPVIPPT